jgi:hypothetical protein
LTKQENLIAAQPITAIVLLDDTREAGRCSPNLFFLLHLMPPHKIHQRSGRIMLFFLPAAFAMPPCQTASVQAFKFRHPNCI